MVACLSSNYDGEPFSCCYAIDPVTGRELDIDVHLELTSEDIAAIYAYERLNYDKTKAALDSLMETYMERSTKASITHAVHDAVEFAFANCGAQPGAMLSEEHVAKLIGLVYDKLEPFMLHLFSSRQFSLDDLRKIAIKSGHLNKIAENEGS